jgi:hypothetical protein
MLRAVSKRAVRFAAGGIAVVYALSCGLGDGDRARQQLGDAPSDAGLCPPPSGSR